MDGGPEGRRARVTVRGDERAVERAVREAGGEIVAPDAAEYLLAVGEAGVASLAADPPDPPVLPVDADVGLHGVASEHLPDALAALADGRFRALSHPLLSVVVDDDPVGRAVLDVTLLTSEPARISEYGIAAADGWVDTVRADGVVAATPAGSAGYARAAGGSVLGHGAGLSVAPIAAFATRVDTWVLRPPVTLSVERDENEVSLYADAEEVARPTSADAVRIERRTDVDLLRVPEATRSV